jgi:hypothetical protein
MKCVKTGARALEGIHTGALLRGRLGLAAYC